MLWIDQINIKNVMKRPNKHEKCYEKTLNKHEKCYEKTK